MKAARGRWQWWQEEEYENDATEKYQKKEMMTVMSRKRMMMTTTTHNTEFKECLVKEAALPLNGHQLYGSTMWINHKTILYSDLPKVGVVHTYPRALVHGQLCYMGLEISNLHTEQLIIQIAMILRYVYSSEDTTSHLIWVLGEKQYGWRWDSVGRCWCNWIHSPKLSWLKCL